MFDALLKKQGPLTSEELEIVKRHPVIGANRLKHVRLFQGRGGITDMVLNQQPGFAPLVVTALLSMEHKVRAWFGLC
jgi:hypothetical protein